MGYAMRAIICCRHGEPAALEYGHLPEPALGEGQVRIGVRACGVNYPDVLMIAGRYQVQPELPFAPGAELSGDILECGPGVRGLATGQRVLALTGHGAMAEQVCVDASRVLPIPDDMSYETAAGFLLAYGTACHALKQRAALAAGETLLVTGAAGGVGLCAVELGRVMGATVIAAASSADKLEIARQHGATHVVNYAEESLRDRTRELTEGRGADVIFDPVGGELFDQCLRSIAWNGRILVIGFAAGSIQAIPANLPLLKGCSVVGVFWGRFVEKEPAVHAENVRELLAHVAAGRLRPHVSEVLPLERGAEALARLAERRAVGKVVVRVAADAG